jgi:oligopeptidase A
MSTNPLLDFSGLTNYSDITPSHVTPAIDALLSQAEMALSMATLDTTPATWADVVAPMDDALDKLNRAWGAVGHLHSVVDTPELRATYTDNLPRVTALYTKLGSDEKLYAKYEAIRASSAFAQLSAEQQRATDLALRSFRLGGAALKGEAKVRHAQIKDEQARLQQQFDEHVMDATDAFAYYASADEVQGIPSDVLQGMADAAKADGQDGRYKITLHQPSYVPVMQYAHSSALRERVYRAYATRASDLAGNDKLDNSALIPPLLKLRDEEARLIGFDSFAAFSLAPKMADSPEQVIGFVRDMSARARPHALLDMDTLREFARRELNIATLNAWDILFASERLREKLYAYSEQEVKQYFTEGKVVAGLFKIVETLFGVHIKPDTAPTWHPDVRFYRVESQAGVLIGQFYFDLYARMGKRPGAWMDIARNRWFAAGKQQTPVAWLTCNFASPVGGKPALLTHDDVITLFHEFGHGLHLLLTQADEPAVGMSTIEWDAVELPSQFMENFCWEWDVVKHMTAHVDTGAQLPRELFDKMLAAKNFQIGMGCVRQMEFALFDMRLHHESLPRDAQTVQRVLDEVRAEVAVVPYPPYHRLQTSFSHLFAGGYAAGYYSYKWAEVLSADAYAAFEEAGNDDALRKSVGARYRDEILGAGARRPAIDSFKAFRGRAPSIDALLRHQGIDRAPQQPA